MSTPLSDTIPGLLLFTRREAFLQPFLHALDTAELRLETEPEPFLAAAGSTGWPVLVDAEGETGEWREIADRLLEGAKPSLFLLSETMEDEEEAAWIERGVQEILRADAPGKARILLRRVCTAWLPASAAADVDQILPKKAYYRHLFHSIPQRAFYKDRELNYMAVNQAYARDLGLRPADVVGRNDLEFFPREIAEKYRGDDRRIMAAGTTEEIEEEYRHKGETLTIHTLKTPVRDETGAVIGVLGIFWDVTELKKNEKALAELNRTLEERVREEVAKNREKDHLMIRQSRQAAMGEMIGNIAHQWRQPLNAAGLIFQKILRFHRKGMLTGENLAESVEQGMALVKKMSSTIDDFRNFFQPDKQRERFNLNRQVEETLLLLEETLAHHDITLYFTPEEEVEITGYPREFSQVLLNLLGNAKDAIVERDQNDGEITIAVSRNGEEGVVTVEDNGGGIPQEALDRIFEPYFTTKPEGKGSGIGLYMSKMIVENNMGGRIRAANGKSGALFRIALPFDADRTEAS